MPKSGAAPVPESILSRVLSPDSPRPLRLAAARGALPLSRQEMVTALVHLITEGDPELHATATETLATITGDSLLEVLQDPETAPGVLAYFAGRPSTSADLLCAVITNPSASDETLEQLAGSTQPEVLERLVTNEHRLMQNRSVVAKLKVNPQLSGSARRRLAELEQHVLADEGGLGVEPTSPVPEIPPDTSSPEATDLPVEEETESDEEAPAPMLEIPLTLEEQAAEESLQRTPLFKRIVTMSVAEKIQAAVKGNAEERAILIRDPVRLVATTVLKSPKLNDSEIEGYAKLRTVNEEVLRIIGNKREWIKSYSVAHALVRNPRTPLALAIGIVKRLTPRDLKDLGLDKNVSEVVRRTAKRLLEQRTQTTRKFGKKK